MEISVNNGHHGGAMQTTWTKNYEHASSGVEKSLHTKTQLPRHPGNGRKVFSGDECIITLGLSWAVTIVLCGWVWLS